MNCAGCGKLIPDVPGGELALCVCCRYHNPPPARAWDEPGANGTPAPQVAYEEAAASIEYEQDHPSREASSAIAEFLGMFAGMKPEKIGRQVLVLAYLAGKTDFKTDAELGNRLGISATRSSRIIREISPNFASLKRLKRRQRKPKSARSPH